MDLRRNYSCILCTVVLIVALLQIDETKAQGFDWQYSARFPTKYPSIFAGGSVALGNGMHFGDNAVGSVGYCGHYTNGSGSFWKAGVNSEIWLEDGVTAIFAALSLGSTNAIFTDESTYLAWEGRDVLYRYQYSLELTGTETALQIGVKRRLPSTHIYGSISIGATAVLAQNVGQFGVITEPFDKVNRTELQPESNFGYSSFLINSTLQIGYDVDLGKNLYASPHVFLSKPFTNQFQFGNAVSVQFGIGISVLYAISASGWR